MFRKYIGESSETSNTHKDEIEKINGRIDDWSNLLGKTNDDIAMLKDMVKKLECMFMMNNGDYVAPEETVDVNELNQALDESAGKSQEINSLQGIVARLEEEKRLQSQHIDEMDSKINSKNREITELNAFVAQLKAEMAQQSQPGGDLAAKLNNKKINAMSTVINNLESEKEEQNQRILGFATQIKEKAQEIIELKTKIDALELASAQEKAQHKQQDDEVVGKLNAKDKAISALHEQMNALAGEKEQQRQQIEELGGLVSDQDEEINRLNDKVHGLAIEKEQQIRKADELSDKINEKNQEINVINTMISRFEEEKRQQNQQIEKLNNAVVMRQQQSNKMENWNELYHPLMEKVYNCMALKAFVEENKLGSAINLETTLQFIRCIGDDYNFAHRIHRAFAIYKREIQESITEREVAVYRAINTYYKNVKQISFDIFMLPNGLSIDDHFCEGMEFDKNEVKDMMTEGVVGFKTIRCVFVPVLRGKNKEIAAKGIVKADTNELF